MSVLLACAAAVALPVLRPRDDWCPSCLRGAAVPMRRSAPLLLQSVCSHHIVRREGSSARLKWRWRLGILKAERSVRGDSAFNIPEAPRGALRLLPLISVYYCHFASLGAAAVPSLAVQGRSLLLETFLEFDWRPPSPCPPPCVPGCVSSSSPSRDFSISSLFLIFFLVACHRLGRLT